MSPGRCPVGSQGAAIQLLQGCLSRVLPVVEDWYTVCPGGKRASGLQYSPYFFVEVSMSEPGE